MSVKDWRPYPKRKGKGKIWRVGGAQAQMALKDLGLVKVTKESAETLFDAGIKFFIVPSKVNSSHFFKGWHLAMEIDPDRHKNEDWTFDQMINDWSYYNENPETGKAAFFVDKKLIA